MIGLAAFFTGNRVAATYTARCAGDYLCFGEVIVDWWWQVVPVEQDETRLAARQSGTLPPLISMARQRANAPGPAPGGQS